MAEAARNVVCAGGQPVAVTNCLNFGNPYKPEVYWVFKEAVGGMGDACRAFNTPVTGGNVSFYNENPDGAVFPTPTIGMLGVVDDVVNHTTTIDFKRAGDHVFLLTPGAWVSKEDINASEYLNVVHGLTTGDAPHFEIDEEKAVQNACLALIRAGYVSSAHDVSDGGLATCLAESAMSSKLGAHIHLACDEGSRLDACLFSEVQSRIVLSVAGENVVQFLALADAHDVTVTDIGRVTEQGFKMTVADRIVVDVSVEKLRQRFEGAIPGIMN